MKSRIAVAVVALALAGAGAAGAPAFAQGFGGAGQVQPPQERINTALARARQVGIPVALLESKIAEGKAKGVSIAIERRQSALERANQALRGQPDASASLAVGADAIESGVSESMLTEVAADTPRDRRNVAIATLTELVHQGHAPQAALTRVKDALKKGPDALTNLPAEAGGGRGRGNANGQGRGNASGRAGADLTQPQAHGKPGPPAGVPAPGKPPQAEKPGGPPADRGGQGTGPNPGRGGR
jgi:hypothetical protein